MSKVEDRLRDELVRDNDVIFRYWSGSEGVSTPLNGVDLGVPRSMMQDRHGSFAPLTPVEGRALAAAEEDAADNDGAPGDGRRWLGRRRLALQAERQWSGAIRRTNATR